MLPSPTTSLVQPTLKGDLATPRRIRHITGIQIRNLTPFPARDAFTSALNQPAEQHHFGAIGAVDDVGTLQPRRRARKLSTTSTATRRSLKWDDSLIDHKEMSSSFESRGRAASNASTAHGNSVHFSTSPTGAKSLNSSRSGHSMRGHRARTSSMTSSSSNNFGTTSYPTDTSSTSIPIPSLLPDNSQTALEKVIHSRLVETFIAIDLPTHETDLSTADLTLASVQSKTPLRSAPLQRTSMTSNNRPQKVGSISLKHAKDIASSSASHRRHLSSPSSAPPTNTTFKALGTIKQDMRSKGPPTSRLNGTASSSTTLSHRKGKSEASIPLEVQKHPMKEPEAPVYFSPIQKPSTNPFYPIDARSGRDFPHWSDTSGQKLKIEAWGKIPTQCKKQDSILTENPHYQSEQCTGEEDYDWKLLDAWELDLNKLIPLPADLDTNPSQLPSNTLLVTLSPPGRAFYLPAPSTSFSRSSSPSGGYASDPELPSTSKTSQFNDLDDSTRNGFPSADMLPVSRRRRHPGVSNSATADDVTTTASWQKLFELVSLQTCILDNESSLSEVVQKIDDLLAADETFPLRRDMAEREAQIKGLHTNHGVVIEQVAEKRLEIAERSLRLKQRRELLISARDAVEFDPEKDGQIEYERTQLTLTREGIASTRTSLVSTLSTIFPIELYFPPDLLYTILDVPLPIPLNSNDPAPPLTMTEHKEVTEEAVATALGYVAQVLQSLSAYIGENLIYPVTCVGSRSLIRDGISAMVGPRMFPLYSKGVDTYRFEYGVFLLNKDIEMLMSERNLRALDIRHTLPNLKNLLLTLSHDAGPKYQPARRIPSPISSASGLETPSRESSPIDDDIQTPKASHSMVSHVSADRTTPTPSGATTPTSSALSDSKAKSFLGFAPLDFLRSRYPSSIHASEKIQSKSSSSQTEGSSDDPESDGDSEPDEEDRMTIHAVASEDHTETQARDGDAVTET